MKRIVCLALIAAFSLVAFPHFFPAAESQEMIQPSDEDVVKTVEGYIKEHSVESGTFDIYDAQEKITRNLELDEVQDDVRKTERNYIVCVDFKDKKSADNLDIDIVLENIEGALRIVDAKVHKINGIPRDSYASWQESVMAGVLPMAQQENQESPQDRAASAVQPESQGVVGTGAPSAETAPMGDGQEQTSEPSPVTVIPDGEPSF